MSILTGPEIADQREAGLICIDPFNREHVGPNSYDVTLSAEMLTYCDIRKANPFGQLPVALDVRRSPHTNRIVLGSSGYVLQPGVLYLAATAETVGSEHYVPILRGRSSLARLGVSVVHGGGFGDLGYLGQWTMSLTVVHPVRIYPGMRVAQIAFFVPEGDRVAYTGKYGGSGPQESRSSSDREGGR